jgi:hypothetical protein
VVVDLVEKVVRMLDLLMEEMDKIPFLKALPQLAEAVAVVIVILIVDLILEVGLVYLEAQVVVAALIVQLLIMLKELLVKGIEEVAQTSSLLELEEVEVVLEE